MTENEPGMDELLEHAVKIGERKYEETPAREEALISPASQMQTVSSIVTAVLFTVTILVEKVIFIHII